MNINPSCLSVDRAISFLKSNPLHALIPARIVVIIPIINTRNDGLFWLYRIIRYTPAVTSVDECTNADTGVGAAIAAGNHAQKGI